MCRKVKYRSKDAAESSLASLAFSGYARDVEWLNTYHCERCGAWHVGRRAQEHRTAENKGK